MKHIQRHSPIEANLSYIKDFEFLLTSDEDNLFSISKLLMRLGIASYCIAAIGIPLYFQNAVMFLCFLLGALFYIPMMCLPYYFIKVFIDMSHNMRKSAQNTDDIKYYLSDNEESEVEE